MNLRAQNPNGHESLRSVSKDIEAFMEWRPIPIIRVRDGIAGEIVHKPRVFATTYRLVNIRACAQGVSAGGVRGDMGGVEYRASISEQWMCPTSSALPSVTQDFITSV